MSQVLTCITKPIEYGRNIVKYAIYQYSSNNQRLECHKIVSVFNYILVQFRSLNILNIIYYAVYRVPSFLVSRN